MVGKARFVIQAGAAATIRLPVYSAVSVICRDNFLNGIAGLG